MEKNPIEAFRKRLRALRESSGITQEQLAEMAGMNYKHYQEIERGGKVEIRFSTFVRLAKAFKIPLYQLFIESEPSAVSIAENKTSYRTKRKVVKKHTK
jgi:transcriptional regulator with XRE-family HTH domain